MGAECIQMFVGPPQSWKKPPPRPDAERPEGGRHPDLRPRAVSDQRCVAEQPHPHPLAQDPGEHRRAAATVGAAGVIVHAGHAEDGIDRGFIRWCKVFEEASLRGPDPHREHGRRNATRWAGTVDVLARALGAPRRLRRRFLLRHLPCTCGRGRSVRRRRTGPRSHRAHRPGACEQLEGRGRHRGGSTRNFADGQMDVEAIAAMVKAAGAPAVICETPWTGIGDDITWLRDRI